jgi:hypothetical protein
MFQKPKGFVWVGFIQCFLALFFVLWFLILPSKGIYFAWPVKPELTAMYLGAGFMLRSFFGYHLWREKDWYKLRWSIHGDLAFLSVLFITTWWHINEMNWHVTGVDDSLRIFCLILAHVWVLAYSFEPITVYRLTPRGEDKVKAEAPVPASLSEGPILPITKTTLLTLFYVGTGIAAILFFNPEFANTRWPWELNAMDARIMAAFPTGVAVWSITMYFMKDWAEIKIGIRSLSFFIVGLFAVGIFAYATSMFDWSRHNVPTVGLATGVLSAMLLYSHWKQQSANPLKKK